MARYVIGAPLAFAEDPNVLYPNSTLFCDELQNLEETLWVTGTVRIGMTSIQGAFCDRINGRGIIARADELFESPTWAHELAHGLGVPYRSDDENALMYAPDPEGDAGYSGNETLQNLNCSECDCMRRASINKSISVEILGAKCGDAGVGSAVEEADQGCSFHVYRTSSGSPAILFVLIAFLWRRSWVRKSRGTNRRRDIMIGGCRRKHNVSGLGWKIRCLVLVTVVSGCESLRGAIDGDAGSSRAADCRDDDGDLFGEGCERGPDCDDTDRRSHRGARELCDDRDNDCDGQFDEGLLVGQPCLLVEGECAVEGVFACAADRSRICIRGANTLPEECNNADDDCDGEIDEGNPGGSDQECGTGLLGACQLGTFQCVEGAMSCEPVVLVGVTPEICDAIDNDCDSYTDESVGGMPIERECYYGPPGTLGLGVCVAGEQSCTYGNWGLCSGMVTPSAEVCDGLDNNCNGVIDDIAGGGNCFCSPMATQDCYGGGPESLDGMGDPRSPCVAGSQDCGDDGRWGECAMQVVPKVEQCNNTDDDCDGTTDEDVPGAGGACHAGTGACRRDGVIACNSGSLGCSASAGSAGTETCNGVDDDCDGVVDDGVEVGDLTVGEACPVGVGACLRNGVVVCDPIEQTVACNAQPGLPGVEACDGIDNDCDALADEGLGLGAVCTAGQGACLRQGAMVCGPGGVVQCSTVAGVATPETCDGVDNNCNGTIDEGFGLGNPCGQGACTGELVCTPGGEVACSGAELATAENTAAMNCADGIDNDCDGTQDGLDSGCM